MEQIAVAVISRDPFFLFATKSLLGRARPTRVCSIASCLDELKTNLRKDLKRIQVLVCDLDSLSASSSFYEELKIFTLENPEIKVFCLVEGMLNHILSQIEEIPIKALVSKHDLSYCLHLAIHAVLMMDRVLVTESVKSLLDIKSTLYVKSRTIGPEIPHPQLTNRITEVVLYRALIGLDNLDLQDEMVLEKDTIRGYISDGYKALGVTNELDAFDALSDWWWITRFAGAVIH